MGTARCGSDCCFPCPDPRLGFRCLSKGCFDFLFSLDDPCSASRCFSKGFLSALVLSLLATVSACGASGIAGGSLLLIPLACSLFGISNDIAMQIVGVGFIIGVIQDSCETALNSSSDVLLTATAEFMQWKKQGRKLPF